VILEANFSPDATRMLQYHPSFYDEVFSCLFLEPTDNPGSAHRQAQENTDGLGIAANGSVGSEAFLPLHTC
jgi:hypothetical protein